MIYENIMLLILRLDIWRYGLNDTDYESNPWMKSDTKTIGRDEFY